jgi:hypothetical protein
MQRQLFVENKPIDSAVSHGMIMNRIKQVY